MVAEKNSEKERFFCDQFSIFQYKFHQTQNDPQTESEKSNRPRKQRTPNGQNLQ